MNHQTMPTTPEKEIGTKADLAKHLSVSQRTVDQWLADGTIPSRAKLRIGNRVVRFRMKVIREWLASV